MKIGLLCLWVLLVSSLPAYASTQADNNSGVSPLRVSQQFSFASPLGIPLRITSGFGRRFHPVTAHFAPHNGADFSAPPYSKVMTIEEGVVTKIASDPISGRYIVITHKNGWVSKYLHLNVFNVHADQRVRKGEVIALSGATGRTTGPHLHLEINYRGQLLDPTLVLNSPVSLNEYSQLRWVKNSPDSDSVKVSQIARIVFVTQHAGKPRIGVKKGKKLIFAKPGDKVFNEFKVVTNGARYRLQKLGGR